MENHKPPVAVIMAAGKSTRMKSRTPKVLHAVAGRAIIDSIVHAAREGCGVTDTIAVVGHAAERVREHLTTRWGASVRYAVQEPQHGTGHAIMQAAPLLEDFDGDVLTLAGDTPLVSAEVLRLLLEHHRATGAAATALTAVMDDPAAYGRILRGADGGVTRIVEARDASEDELAVHEINTSIYCFRAKALFGALGRLRPENAQGEYYLTDVIALLAGDGERVEAVVSPDPAVVMGVNTRVELAEAGEILRARKLHQMMLDGVTIIDPRSTYVDLDVSVGPDTTLHPGTVLQGATTIGSGCEIGPFSQVRDSALGDDVRFLQSVAVLSEIEDGARVGPFSSLRPGTVMKAGSRAGSFVEMKKATLGEGASVAHLSYIGDATVGAKANIGGGTITCNYDGNEKHTTTIGAGAFIGSNNTLVAPVSVGDGAFTAAGSAITEDVPADALAIGRARQTIKEGWAGKRRNGRDGSGR
jgi:bifunctional UDP-N-acetylglucosamine pyrophosphorylase/glucosamine-1-phosphate N-acetyltransferase